MKKIKLRTVFIFMLAALSGGMLLYTSQNVQQAERELSRIKISIAQEQESIRVLNAEWAYLNSPARLETLASDYLKMKAPLPAQFAPTPSVLPDHLIEDQTNALLQPVSQQGGAQ